MANPITWRSVTSPNLSSYVNAATSAYEGLGDAGDAITKNIVDRQALEKSLADEALAKENQLASNILQANVASARNPDELAAAIQAASGGAGDQSGTIRLGVDRANQFRSEAAAQQAAEKAAIQQDINNTREDRQLSLAERIGRSTINKNDRTTSENTIQQQRLDLALKKFAVGQEDKTKKDAADKAKSILGSVYGTLETELEKAQAASAYQTLLKEHPDDPIKAANALKDMVTPPNFFNKYSSFDSDAVDTYINGLYKQVALDAKKDEPSPAPPVTPPVAKPTPDVSKEIRKRVGVAKENRLPRFNYDEDGNIIFNTPPLQAGIKSFIKSFSTNLNKNRNSSASLREKLQKKGYDLTGVEEGSSKWRAIVGDAFN